MQSAQLPSLFTLSDQQELLLFLIQKELQGNRFAQALAQLGCHEPSFQTDLGKCILRLAGFEQYSNELWEWFCELVEQYATQIDLHQPNSQQAIVLAFYVDLQGRYELEQGKIAQQPSL